MRATRSLLAVAVFCSLAALSCGGGGGDGPTGPAPVASIFVVLSVTSLKVGETTIAVATLKDANGHVLSGRALTWSSSDANVATVTADGVVTANATGTAGISAASEGVSGAATLTVTVVPIATVSVSLVSSSIYIGASTQATATPRDANGNVLTGRSFVWSSDNTAVARVNASGFVIGISAGSAGITATSEGHSASATVTVTLAPVASVTVSLARSSVAIGSRTQATATTRDPDGRLLVGRGITWSSDNVAVATVSGSGEVNGVGSGTANIIATSEGISGSAAITVAPPVGYGSSAEKIRIVDIATTFSPTLSGPGVGATAFVSRATSIATVDAQGVITGVGEGQVWVVASASGWMPDSVYVIVPRTATGPILRTDLTTFYVTAGTTTTVNIILDTRSTPIGGTELSVGITTSTPVFQNATIATTGTPEPVLSVIQPGVARASLASGNALSGQLSILQLTFTTPTLGSSGFLTLTFLDLVGPTGTDLLPVSTSTRIPIVVR